MLRGARLTVAIVGLVLVAACQGADEEPAPTPGSASVVRVPDDVKTLADAAATVAKNGLILIGPGTYRETLEIHTEGVTVRGTDRNTVVIDGEGMRSNGVVATAGGITVENLTVKDHLLNGILMTGVTDKDGNGIGRGSDGYEPLDPKDFPPIIGFAVRNTTVAGNGLYGIYAFNRNVGTIENNYASGSSDSGVYVGQCENCRVTVSANVAERNAIGLEMANASGVTIVGNRFARNRIGASIQSNYQEAYVPQREAQFVGNIFSDNNEAQSPAVAEGGFGTGLALQGTSDIVVERNRIERNDFVGVGLVPAEDIDSQKNTVRDNLLSANGHDIAMWTTGQGAVVSNCVEPSRGASTWPEPLPASQRCDGEGELPATEALTTGAAPPGLPFLEVPTPGDLPGLTFADPAADYGPVTTVAKLDLAGVKTPPADLLQAWVQQP